MRSLLKYELYPSTQVAASRISEYYTNISLCNAYSLMREAATWLEGYNSYFTLIDRKFKTPRYVS